MFKTIKKILLWVILAILLWMSLLIFLNKIGVIIWNSTPSLNYGFYLKSPFNKQIKEKNIVCYELTEKESDLIHSLDTPRFKGKTAEETLKQLEEYDKQPRLKYLIKRVQIIDGDKIYLIGNSSEEIEKQSGVKGLKSLDSSNFLGAVSKDRCQKVYYLRVSSNVMLLFIKLGQKLGIKK